MSRQWLFVLIGLTCVAALISLPTLQDVPGCIRANVWPKSLIALHVIADGLISVAYVWIPITLIFVWQKRDDIPFNWTLLCFAAFIVFCGLTHVMAIVTTWRPLYWLAGEIKAATGLVSIATAGLLTFRVYPSLLLIPTAGVLREALERAEREAEVARDATERAKEAQAQLAEANAKLSGINTRLEISIRELSTPVLEVQGGILLVPIVGSIDSDRAELLMETIGEAVTTRGARTVLLDLTGVPLVDTAVTSHLIKTAAMISLLGARCVATGIRPAVARTIVELGADLSIQTSGSLSQGLALAMEDRYRRH